MGAEQSEWIDRIVGIASRLGFNPVRTRWKLIALHRRYEAAAALTLGRWKHARYEHQVCSHCNAVQDRTEVTCTKCGTKLDPRWLQRINRICAGLGTSYSSTFLLGLFILIGFWRSCMGPEGFDLGRATSGYALLQSGGSLAFPWIGREWWRLASCIFLHAGLLHLLFNLVALKQIGPDVEATFGRGRMLFFFMVTGLVASLGSSLTGTPGLRIGASGAIMGLTGIAAGWGHRLGTRHGIDIRNHMLRWAMYTILYGYLLHADNVAHAVGFLTGAGIGFLAREREPRGGASLADWALTLTGLVIASFAVSMVAFPSLQPRDARGDVFQVDADGPE